MNIHHVPIQEIAGWIDAPGIAPWITGKQFFVFRWKPGDMFHLSIKRPLDNLVFDFHLPADADDPTVQLIHSVLPEGWLDVMFEPLDTHKGSTYCPFLSLEENAASMVSRKAFWAADREVK